MDDVDTPTSRDQPGTDFDLDLIHGPLPEPARPRRDRKKRAAAPKRTAKTGRSLRPPLRPTGSPKPAGRPGRRIPLLALGGALTLAAVVVGIVATTGPSLSPAEAARQKVAAAKADMCATYTSLTQDTAPVEQARDGDQTGRQSLIESAHGLRDLARRKSVDPRLAKVIDSTATAYEFMAAGLVNNDATQVGEAIEGRRGLTEWMAAEVCHR